MNPLDFLNPGRWLMLLAAVAALTLGYFAWADHQQNIGEARVQLKWDASVSRQRAAALAESEANAKESKRRIERQQENQNVQDAQLAAARADAARNAADADRVRAQSADTARQWRDALDRPPVVGDRQAAAAAIAVLTDVRSRLDAAATELAGYATASRAAGLKCERDYESLTPPP